VRGQDVRGQGRRGRFGKCAFDGVVVSGLVGPRVAHLQRPHPVRRHEDGVVILRDRSSSPGLPCEVGQLVGCQAAHFVWMGRTAEHPCARAKMAMAQRRWQHQ
jgi:hypothetical protein